MPDDFRAEEPPTITHLDGKARGDLDKAFVGEGSFSCLLACVDQLVPFGFISSVCGFVAGATVASRIGVSQHHPARAVVFEDAFYLIEDVTESRYVILKGRL